MQNYKTLTAFTDVMKRAERKIQFREFVLANGLHCIMHCDKSNPIVSVTVGYKVGSKDEPKGYHGVAHLFEHMMFQGSENIRKNEHFGHVLRVGGSCNAFTMQDATVYFETLTSSGLETGLWLESDRMNSLDISRENLENQKSVVLEEKKQVFDNAPYGNMYNHIFELIFKGSGYEHSIIGKEEDLRSFTVEGAREFHSKFYSPCNAVLVIAGDIDYAETEKLVTKYFGGLRHKCDIPRLDNVISPVSAGIRKDYYDNIQLPAINMCYQIPGAGSDADEKLDFFADIMGNSESSRLYKRFVYHEKRAQAFNVSRYPLSDSGIFMIRAYVNPGVDVELLRNDIHGELVKFTNEGCTEHEFEKIRNSLEFASIARHLKIQNIAIETVFNHLMFKDADRINRDTERYLEVKKDDIAETAREYVTEAKCVVVNYLPNENNMRSQ